MKIAHLIFSMCIGGAEVLLVDIINEQVKNNDVSLFILNDVYSENILVKLDPRVKIKKFQRKPGAKGLYPIIMMNLQLKCGSFDIIHCHNSSMPKLLMTSLLSSKIIYTVHDVALCIQHANKITHAIAISNAVAEDVATRYHFPLTVVYNGINYQDIKNKTGNINSLNLRIVNIARLVHDKKGQDILIRAVAILKKKNIKLTVDFIGEGESLEYLKNLTKALDVEENVHFLGSKNREYIYNHLCDYDLMCHPARYEGFGLSVIEGMAAKIPVLVSNEGGPYEIIQHDRFGFSFKTEDHRDCAAMIEHIINNPSVVEKKIEPAYMEVKEKYSITSVCNRYMKVYES